MFGGMQLKDPTKEIRLFSARAIVAAAGTVLLMLVLVARLYHLQVANHAHFTTLSQNNRVTVLPLAPTRGLIYDRNGVVVAENLPTFSLEIIPEQVTDMEATIDRVAEIIEVTDIDRRNFYSTLRRKRRFEEIPLRYRLSEEEVARIAVNRHRLPGVEINSRLMRHYPLGPLMAHSVGYVGRIDEDELRELDPSNYAATNVIGKLGVERAYEETLHGTVGHQQVETNARGRILRVLEQTPPVPGRHLFLNLDVRLQRVAEQAFANERGALVAIDPNTGAVLALVSMPGYDPNLFVNGIAEKDYQALSNSADQPLFNRALKGQYPPGSTIKPFVGLAALEMRQASMGNVVACPGYYTLKGDDRRYRDWKKRGHGPISMSRAIVESCDVYFYDLSLKLGIDRLSQYMQYFGFGQPTGIDIGGERSGLMPTREWKRRVRGEAWYPGETLITGIGQGFTLATPLQLAAATATLASGGTRLAPNVVQALADPTGGALEPVASRPLTPVSVEEKYNWRRIGQAMEQVVHSIHGTARGMSRNVGYRIAAKTGTAQVFGIAQDAKYVAEEIAKRLRDHALIVAFAPADGPQIAVAVIVENGGSGGAVAGPVARRVMDAYLQEELPHVAQ